ncbi:MAG: cupin domain-containing protein [Fulvivirga sp.]|nr:cupin domain-containing protein [Fulvivirga sp.]
MKNQNSYWVLGHRISPKEVSGNYDMVIGETPPNVPGPPPHYHANLDELFHVLEGTMEFIINGERKLVHQGESVDLPRNVIHTFGNAGDSTCKWLNIHYPKGFQSFFMHFGVPENEKEAVEKSVNQKIIDEVMQKATDFDMHIKI